MAGTVAREPAHPHVASPRAVDPRGEGDLYAGGLNYSTTGVFYNKDQAAQIGMTEPPATLEEFRGCWRQPRRPGSSPSCGGTAASGGEGSRSRTSWPRSAP
ncbi:MAG: hypothetical protein R3C32_01800 [Chloroflexota bacterium]